MNYADVRELSVHRGKLSATLYIICNDRWGCINKINSLCVKAAQEVRAQYATPAGESLAKKLEGLHSRIPVEEHIRSVALFVNDAIAWAYALPYVTQDAIHISDHFILDDIITHFSQAIRYWVLMLFHEKPFLFDGYNDVLLEVVHRHNLATREERVDVNDIAGRVCSASVWRTNCRYTSALEFMHAVDAGLKHFIESDPLPLVICSDKIGLEHFSDHSYYADRVLLSVPITDVYDREELQAIVWPLLQKSYTHLKKEMLMRLNEACQAHLCARGIAEVWRALREGRAQYICVSRDYRDSICELFISNTITETSERCHDGSVKDGLTSLVTLALSEGVPICWFDKDELKDFFHVAAIVSSADQEIPITS